MEVSTYKLLTGDLIESTNFYSAILSLLLWIRCWRWKLNGSAETIEIVTALQWMFAASAIRHTWFAVSRFLHNGSTWNNMMYELRPIAVVATSLMLTYGAIRLWGHLEDQSFTARFGIAAVVAIVAFGIGFS